MRLIGLTGGIGSGKSTVAAMLAERGAIERDEDWVELVPGTPVVSSTGSLLWCGERDGVRSLVTVAGRVTPAHLHVRSVISSSDTRVWISANDVEHPEVLDTYSVALDGSTCERVTDGDGVNTSVMSDATRVARCASFSTILHSKYRSGKSRSRRS